MGFSALKDHQKGKNIIFGGFSVPRKIPPNGEASTEIRPQAHQINNVANFPKPNSKKDIQKVHGVHLCHQELDRQNEFLLTKLKKTHGRQGYIYSVFTPYPPGEGGGFKNWKIIGVEENVSNLSERVLFFT